MDVMVVMGDAGRLLLILNLDETHRDDLNHDPDDILH
jgi:hypothetical protein